MDFSNLRMHCYRFTPAAFHTVWNVRLTVICSHCLAASPGEDVWGQQPHAEIRNNYRNLSNLWDSLPCYCYATKGNSATMRSQIRQRESAGEGVEMSELQAHHCITPEQWSLLLCSVSAIPVNKVLLQELNRLIGIKMPASDFLKSFVS